MANYDQRVPVDDAFGQLSGSVNAVATTLNSPDFANLPSGLSAVRYVPMTLADDSQKLYETVWVTGHNAGSTTITVVRGREGSSARSWGTGTLWRCAATARDMIAEYATRALLPGDAHLGMRARILDDGGGRSRVVEKLAAGWRATDPIFGHAGRTDGFQALGVVVVVAAQELAGGMTFTAGGLVVPIGGLYDARARAYIAGTGTGRYNAAMRVNGTSSGVTPGVQAWRGDTGDHSSLFSGFLRLAAGDSLTLAEAGPSGAQAWGTTGYDGAWVEALYVGP